MEDATDGFRTKNTPSPQPDCLYVYYHDTYKQSSTRFPDQSRRLCISIMAILIPSITLSLDFDPSGRAR